MKNSFNPVAEVKNSSLPQEILHLNLPSKNLVGFKFEDITDLKDSHLPLSVYADWKNLEYPGLPSIRITNAEPTDEAFVVLEPGEIGGNFNFYFEPERCIYFHEDTAIRTFKKVLYYTNCTVCVSITGCVYFNCYCGKLLENNLEETK